jgi:hypothetical protein
MAVKYECDNCSRTSLKFSYYQCPDCDVVSCDECADKAGTKVGLSTVKPDDGFLKSFLKGAGAALIKACPKCGRIGPRLIHNAQST